MNNRKNNRKTESLIEKTKRIFERITGKIAAKPPKTAHAEQASDSAAQTSRDELKARNEKTA